MCVYDILYILNVYLAIIGVCIKSDKKKACFLVVFTHLIFVLFKNGKRIIKT